MMSFTMRRRNWCLILIWIGDNYSLAIAGSKGYDAQGRQKPEDKSGK
jgi:hypothetical protein